MPAALRAAGQSVVVHQEHFAGRAGLQDQDWISEIARHGWVVLTKDKSFKRRELEKNAILAGGVRSFFLSATDLTGAQQAQIFVDALPRLHRICARHPGPFIARITRLGQVDVIFPAKARR